MILKKNEKINIWCSSFYSAIYFYFYFVYFKTCWKYWFFSLNQKLKTTLTNKKLQCHISCTTSLYSVVRRPKGSESSPQKKEGHSDERGTESKSYKEKGGPKKSSQGYSYDNRRKTRSSSESTASSMTDDVASSMTDDAMPSDSESVLESITSSSSAEENQVKKLWNFSDKNVFNI